jgi:hypothetical protein
MLPEARVENCDLSLRRQQENDTAKERTGSIVKTEAWEKDNIKSRPKVMLLSFIS